MLLVRLPKTELEAKTSFLERHLALSFDALVDASTCGEWVRGVYEARSQWTGAFGGEQFSLGRAWYTDLEEDRARTYFENARASDALVERQMPGMQARLRELAGAVIGADVVARPGWCGPGVHIFPAHQEVACNGGVVHFDTEGLTEAHVAARAPAFTLVLMLQPPEAGGGLRVWDVLFSGSHQVTEEMLGATSVVARYQTGDLVVIDSYRLHQIQPFGGDRDRVSITCHAAFVAGRWETWF